MTLEKIKRHHCQKIAYVYLRQSSPGQVKKNVEGSRRQRQMEERLKELGWPASRICVLGGDTGHTGSSLHGREDYQVILEGVLSGQAGAVAARELSRLVRDNQDWNQLVRFCRHQDVLLIDEHRIYNPADPQDRVVLGVAGAFNEFELAMIIDRMQESRRQKAARGELYDHIATGYVLRSGTLLEKHPDDRVRRAVYKVFDHIDALGRTNRRVDSGSGASGGDRGGTRSGGTSGPRSRATPSVDRRSLASLSRSGSSRCAGVQRERRHVQQAMLDHLGDDVDRIWHHPRASMALKKQIVRLLVKEIVIDLDKDRDELVLCVHWSGGHPTDLVEPRLRRPSSLGSNDLIETIETLRKVMSDGVIATTLNRAKIRPPSSDAWTGQTVKAFRLEHAITGFSARAKGKYGWLTQAEAANRLSISAMSVTRLVRSGILPAEQTASGLPAVISAVDFDLTSVQQAVNALKTSPNRPLTDDPNQLTLFPTTDSQKGVSCRSD